MSRKTRLLYAFGWLLLLAGSALIAYRFWSDIGSFADRSIVLKEPIKFSDGWHLERRVVNYWPGTCRLGLRIYKPYRKATSDMIASEPFKVSYRFLLGTWPVITGAIGTDQPLVQFHAIDSYYIQPKNNRILLMPGMPYKLIVEVEKGSLGLSQLEPVLVVNAHLYSKGSRIAAYLTNLVIGPSILLAGACLFLAATLEKRRSTGKA